MRLSARNALSAGTGYVMSETSDFRTQLKIIGERYDSERSIFLVLSGTSDAAPVHHFYKADGMTARPLFLGTQYASWQEVMPFLAQVNNTSAFLDWIDETDSIDWGWGLVSDASFDEVFCHIRSLTKIFLPEGQEVFFRYWAPRFWGAILENVDEICRAQLMGPAGAVVMPDGRRIQHPGTPAVAKPVPEFPWFSLPEATLTKIASLCWDQLVDNTISVLGEKKPSALSRYPSPIARQKVERQLRRLAAGEVLTELSPEQVQTIHQALMHEALQGAH